MIWRRKPHQAASKIKQAFALLNRNHPLERSRLHPDYKNGSHRKGGLRPVHSAMPVRVAIQAATDKGATVANSFRMPYPVEIQVADPSHR